MTKEIEELDVDDPLFFEYLEMIDLIKDSPLGVLELKAQMLEDPLLKRTAIHFEKLRQEVMQCEDQYDWETDLTSLSKITLDLSNKTKH